jgi:flap endonuclease-1
MGIKNLNTIIMRHATNSVTQIHLKDLANKRVVIDTPIYLYKFIHNSGDPIVGLIKQISKLVRYRIIPIYILDGKPPKEKSHTLNERRKHKNNIKNKITILNAILNNDNIENNILEKYDTIISEYKEMNSDELEYEIIKNNKRLINVTDQHINRCKQLFELMGIPYIVADCEAEILCARMTKHGYADACLSEDTDILPNGGKIFLRNLNNNYITKYNFNDILHELGMTYDMFVDMCILCGCDYTNTIKGIGPVNAYNLIHKYNNIENIIQYELPRNNKYKINNFKYINARNIFKNNEYDITEYANLKRKPPHTDLAEFIQSNTTLNNNYIKNLNKLLHKNIIINKKNKINTLHNYFTSEN